MSRTIASAITSCHNFFVSDFIKKFLFVLVINFVDDRKQVFHLGRGRISVTENLKVCYFCNVSKVSVAVASEQNARA